MVQEYHIGDEPIPGYRLTKFLGRGGFGEVWQAVAPGRTEVALKIISLDRKQGMKEFRSLRLVKRIRHPNLVPILAFWLKDSLGNVLDDDSIDMLDSGIGEASARSASVLFNAARADQLVIAMGLGDMNLLALLQDYQAAGQAGIPAEELLDYMEGCARAIDYLNTARHDLGAGPVAIQHCDIKPQNIMIVGDAVQLCDFGLARSLTDVRSTSVAGSIAYGAPELFWENKPSGATDQYSLAVSYYELRTGCLPFGLEMAQLEVMQAHRDGTLDLSRVDDGERAVLVRATAPSPGARFERTIDMVRALRRAIQSASHVEAIEPPPPGRSNLAGSALLESGREILPGYRLLEHLFYADSATDVWSAAAPGAKQQALWIYDLSRAEGLPDLASLRMAQKFANPHLARLSEFWLLDEAGDAQLLGPHLDQAALASCRRLIAVSELTRTNLAHRLEECRESLGTGIPQPELLAYLRMTAEGVDALNAAWHPLDESRKASLLHRELRPENLLLFHHDVKIGNLAWVRALESDAIQLPESARRPTRIFSAPELARDRLTRWSDQYALAVCYAVMRTGKWLGDAPSGAIQPGLQQLLDPAALPPAEAEVLAKALQARPEQRFADCRQMVAALEKASRASPLAAPAIQPEAKPAAPWYGTIVAPSAQAAANAPSGDVQLAEAAVAGSIADTNPEPDARRSTIVEPFPAAAAAGAIPSARRGRRLGRIFVAMVVAIAAGAAFLIGDDVKKDVDDLAAAGQYQAAIEAADQAPIWRRWRVDGPTVKREVARKAATAAAADGGEAAVSDACSIYAALAAVPELLMVQDTAEFRETILPLAVGVAEKQAATAEFGKAIQLQKQLGAVLGENFKVIQLNDNIFKQADKTVRVYADQGDFQRATDVCRQLAEVISGDPKLDALRYEVISLGSEAVRRRREEDDFVVALQIVGQLETAFPDDAGVRDVVRELVPEAIGAVEKDLEQLRFVEAGGVYRELARLRPHDSKVANLGASIRNHEIEIVGQLLKEGKWEGALTAFERIAGEWPEADLDELQDGIAKKGIEAFQSSCQAENSGRAEEIKKRLAAAFPKDVRITNLKCQGPPPGERQDIVTLLDQADKDVNDDVPDQAEAKIRQAEKLLNKHADGWPDLSRRLSLTQAHLALRRQAWDEALRQLTAVDPDGFDKQREVLQRTRFYLLRALATARFDGGDLGDDAELDRIAAAVQAACRSNPEWPRLGEHRLAIAKFAELAERLIARIAELAFDPDGRQAELAAKLLSGFEAGDVQDLRDLRGAQFWATKTHLLLAGPKIPWSDVEQSMASWLPSAQSLPRGQLARLASDIARASVASDQADAVDRAADALRGLRSFGIEIRREYVGLLIEQLARQAGQPRPDWKLLKKRCQEAAIEARAVGGHPREAVLAACEAECMLETAPAESAAALDEAQRKASEIAPGEAAPSDRPYLDYVRAAVNATADARRDDPAAVGVTFSGLFEKPSGLLAAPFRQARAMKLLTLAAGRQMQLAGAAARDGLEPVPADAATGAAGWLQVAETLRPQDPTSQGSSEPRDESLANELTLLRAVAAFYKTPQDLNLAAVATGKLIEAGETNPRIYLINARALERIEPEQALRRYAEALGAAKMKPQDDRLKNVYQQIVKPGLALAGGFQAKDPSTRRAIASLFAAKGKLLLLDGEVCVLVEQEGGKSMQAEIFEAYQKAIDYDPSVADYYVERGMARYELPKCDLEELKTQDLDAAKKLFAGSEPIAAFYGLQGCVDLQTARLQAGPAAGEKRLQSYKAAIDSYEQAVRRCGENDENPARFLVGGSLAHLELANYTNEPDDVIRGYLLAAQKSADEATNIEPRPHPEFAWLAKGNAEEDFGYLLGDRDHHDEALDAFERAKSDSLLGGSSPGKAGLSLGRARMRMANSGLQTGEERKASLALAATELEAATRSSLLSNDSAAEAYHWLSNIYLSLGRTQEADDAARLAKDKASSTQGKALYFYTWALSAPEIEQKRIRAKSLLDDPASAASSMLRAQLVQLAAASYIRDARKPAEQDLRQGLKEYERYFPWLSDVSKAGADDIHALIFVSQHILASKTFWKMNGNFELCKQCAERALALAEQAQAISLAAKARTARALHRSFVADSDPSQLLSAKEKAAAKQKAAQDFAELVQLDDRLSTAPLTARERREIDDNLSWLWRYSLAQTNFQVADDTATSGERVNVLCDEAIKALDNARHVPANARQLRAGLRAQLAALKSARGVPKAKPN